MSVKTVAAVGLGLGLALAAVAAPMELEARNTGDFTYYYTGLGACGQTNHDGELVAAVGHGLYDRVHPCGRNIRLHYKGRSVVARVVDRCAGCNDNSVDLSPAAFRAVVGDLGLGRVKGTWEFV
ncbi:hypothetical protein UVI_02015280 [Ustilaginoidea virens]|uniref:RlpA-like protein double-psi beta-barrel domain-containing protein n=1 Tax=Ustilaginoidea virens TaxID=1159556 RepID=A0A1B5KRZ4_USTVR|nr:hypothetical protein UVI_02015280 [Ustilaginoidea virens]